MSGAIIGVLLIFAMIIIWQIFSITLDLRIRYAILSMIVMVNMFFVLFSSLRKFGSLLLVFWGVISAAFLLAEFFPKKRNTRQNTLMRRERISMLEDYLFTVGIAMLGIEIWIWTMFRQL